MVFISLKILTYYLRQHVSFWNIKKIYKISKNLSTVRLQMIKSAAVKGLMVLQWFFVIRFKIVGIALLSHVDTIPMITSS